MGWGIQSNHKIKHLTNLVECGTIVYNNNKGITMKNFNFTWLTSETGHKASDVWFKNQPTWFDSDMIGGVLFGMFLGMSITTLFFILPY